MYWIEWIEDGEKKSIVADGWVEWASILENLISSDLSMLNGNGFKERVVFRLISVLGTI